MAGEGFQSPKKQQPPMTVEEQICNLKELGLVFENEDYANSFLNDVSYFRLIKAFSLGLKPKNGNYVEGTTFEQIVELYKFNCNFRQLLFTVIERRNLCAHYGRIYNAKLSKTPKLYKQYSSQGIGNIRLFGVLVCINHLIPHDEHWDTFVNEIQNLINKYPAVKIETMRFPSNWSELLCN